MAPDRTHLAPIAQQAPGKDWPIQEATESYQEGLQNWEQAAAAAADMAYNSTCQSIQNLMILVMET